MLKILAFGTLAACIGAFLAPTWDYQLQVKPVGVTRCVQCDGCFAAGAAGRERRVTGSPLGCQSADGCRVHVCRDCGLRLVTGQVPFWARSESPLRAALQFPCPKPRRSSASTESVYVIVDGVKGGKVRATTILTPGAARAPCIIRKAVRLNIQGDAGVGALQQSSC